MAGKPTAIALTSDSDKSNYKEEQSWIVYPELFQKINEKINAKCGVRRALLLYLIFQKQNGGFSPAEATICQYCACGHSAYVEARTWLNEQGYITYVPYKEICINYKKILE
jgi:hypothetical protein